MGGDNSNTVDAGLPEIKGSFSFASYNQSAQGAFSFTSTGSQSPASGNNLGGRFNFAASKSNAIYGKSETVQPPAIILIAQIKY